MSRSLYLIDGHAQIYRAYFARFGNLTSPGGEPTRATHVFCQMLLSMLRDRKPDYLVMVMDVADETVFRREIYPAYKANREPSPEDLSIQAERIVSILEAARVPVLRMPRFEADDIMATLARQYADSDLHVFLVSRDKDLDQLLGPHVSLYDPFKDEVITHEQLFELKGWTPEQAIDAQTLIGDSVDNVPGVPGIGEKTAAKLLQKYGTAQGVIDHADELSPKQRDQVRAFATQMPVTRRLVTLCPDVPIKFSLDAAAVERFAWPAAMPILRELGFRRLVEQWPMAGVAAPGKPAESLFEAAADHATPRSAPATISESSSTAAEAAEGLLSGAQLARPVRGPYQLITSIDALDAFTAELSLRREFALDTETTGVNPVDADLVGLSISWGVGHGVYIPVQSVYGSPLPIDAVRARLGPVFANSETLKVGHNIKYDLIILRNAGMPVSGPMFDTMIAAFAADPMRNSFGMDRLVADVLGHVMIPITDLIGKGRDQLRMDQVPLEHIAEYAAEDADYTWRLRQYYEPRLHPAGVDRLFYETEMPLVRVLTEMEYNGINLDAEYLKTMSVEMATRAADLTAAIQTLAGVPFNPDSTKQLAEVLYDRLHFPVVKRTKTARSTDAESLELISQQVDHQLPRLLLEYREIQKLRGTYVDALPLARSRRTGRIHTSFHQTGAITGRLSSSEPNLQNIPIRTELGRRIRRAFVARTPQERLIVADYSQIELRVLAHFSEDEALRSAFVEDLDIHAVVAAQVNGVALDAVTREMRSRAKAVNFGIIYGQTAFGLARSTGMNRTEAQGFIDAYFRRYAKVRSFIEECISRARRDGGVRTILGRHRPILGIDSRNASVKAQAERLAVNTVIQGSAADLIKTAMIKLHDRIRSESLPMRILLQVHDELVCEAPQDQIESMMQLVADVMTHALPLRVPLKVDVASAENWLEAK